MTQRAIAVTALIACALGVAAGLVLAPQPAPESFNDFEVVDEAPVVASIHDDARDVSLRLTWAPRADVLSMRSGRVTGLRGCDAGADVASGSVIAFIDGEPVVALATATPLWRDLQIGDRGADAQSLENELARLGHSVPVDGVVDASTVAATNAVLSSAGTPAGGSAIRLADFVWLPAATTTIAECAAQTGSLVSAGSPLAASVPALESAIVDPLPGASLDGARVVALDGAEFAVGSGGIVSDLAGLQALPSVAATTDDEPVVAAVWKLEAPVDVATVPAAAVIVDGSTSCVVADDAVHEVTVVGSRLGSSYVVFSDAAPAAVDLNPDIAACT